MVDVGRVFARGHGGEARAVRHLNAPRTPRCAEEEDEDEKNLDRLNRIFGDEGVDGSEMRPLPLGTSRDNGAQNAGREPGRVPQ